MAEYICKKCSLKTKKFSDMKRHINKKIQCLKKLDSMSYTNSQLFVLSLIPYYNDKQIDINISEINNEIFNNKDKMFDILNKVDKENCKVCPYCNMSFDKNIDLKNHIIITCFSNELKKHNSEKNIDTMNVIVGDVSNSIVNSSVNITNITNNITVNVKNPIPFDKDWDLSMLDDYCKQKLIFSKIMYTNLLEELLKNGLNLNVIIDKENNSGMVYKNDDDKYIQMKIKDIVDDSMKKLYKNLQEINNEIMNNSNFFEDILKLSRQKIEEKYNNYVDNTKIQKDVERYITNIFDNKKTDAIKISKNIDCSERGF